MTTKEITIYEKNEKTYCENCKPQGGKRGTLVISLPDRVFCSGCGEDFYKEVTPEHEGFTLCADGETLVPMSKHYDTCDCEACEAKKWKQAEREQFARYNATSEPGSKETIMTERYLPIDGDILVRIDGPYFETYLHINGTFKRQVTALLSRPTAIQAWLDGWRVTLVKSTQDVMGHELCGFYHSAP